MNSTNGAKLWNYAISGAVRMYPFPTSSPAVVNGAVYVGSYNGNVYALNATSGDKLWNYTTCGMVLSSPAVANGVVYVGGEKPFMLWVFML